MFDLLFSITEWLRSTLLLDFAFWITETSLSAFMVENFWVLPTVQVVHILGIGMGFASLLMLTVRLRHAGGHELAISDAAARYMKWMWMALLVIVISGILMITAEPIRNMVNAVFWFKMLFLVIAVAITLAFQKAVRTKALAGGPGYVADSASRRTGLILVLVWCLIILCGRWIAYVPV